MRVLHVFRCTGETSVSHSCPYKYSLCCNNVTESNKTKKPPKNPATPNPQTDIRNLFSLGISQSSQCCISPSPPPVSFDFLISLFSILTFFSVICLFFLWYTTYRHSEISVTSQEFVKACFSSSYILILWCYRADSVSIVFLWWNRSKI